MRCWDADGELLGSASLEEGTTSVIFRVDDMARLTRGLTFDVKIFMEDREIADKYDGAW